ncbi:MAG: TonB-dependent receptor [Saprospiraceae bacterium]|nr:TonB-dependent receptor [Saprospiraceae bacterium]
MAQSKLKLFNLLFIFFGAICINAQELKFLLIDGFTLAPVADASIVEGKSGLTFYSDQNGRFTIPSQSNEPKAIIKINHKLYKEYTGEFSFGSEASEIVIEIFQNENSNIDLSTIQIEGTDDSNNDESEVYSILGSSRNPIQQAIAYEFSIMRYRNRGISNRYDQLGINGFLVNDVTTGQVPYYLISGQNQINKYSENRFSYPEQIEDFGSAGNSQWADCRLRNYREGLTFNYSLSNRSYTHRLGLHYVKSSANKSLIYMFGANRRWAQEAAFPGTFYDAYGVYAGIQKTFNNKLQLHFISIFAPVVRSKSAPVVNETVELTSNSLYNPNWGYQVGEKRNARMVNTRVPAFLLTLERKGTRISDTWGVMFAKGKRSNSTIDWTDVRDPRPDYYQFLPSYEENAQVKASKIQTWKQSDPSVTQLNWDYFYQSNYSNIETIKNINGGIDSIRGRRSLYILMDEHADPQDFEAYVRRKIQFSPRKSLLLNLRFENMKIHYYNRMLDLLGGDYFVDYENFIVGDQNANTNNRNHIVAKGDQFGRNYEINSSRFTFYQQYSHSFRRVDWNVGLEQSLQWNSLQRNFKNSIFPKQEDDNAGIMKKPNLSLKSNLAYKVNGRNYFLWNFGVSMQNPSAEQIFINPTWRGDRLPVEDQIKIFSTDVSYKYSSPELKFQVNAYASWFMDQILTRRFFLDAGSEDDPDSELLDGGFINGFYTNLDEQHIGLEAALQFNISPKLELSLVAQKGEYIYIDRPEYYIYDQFSTSQGKHLVYLNNFFVAGSPQTAASLGLKYEFVRYGSLRLTANYLADNYVEINPLRRIPEAVDGVERNSTALSDIINQEKLKNAIVINASAFKSWKVKKSYISISLNVGNLLNNKDLLSGGFEQSRFDYDEKNINKFPNKYFHLQGINYFLNLNYSFN